MQIDLQPAKTVAANLQSTVYLYQNIWKQNSTALLHAPVSVDKTSYTLDIIEEITRKGEQVVYVDTQSHLSDNAGRISSFDNLFVLTPRYESPDDMTDYADLVISSIEEAIRTSDIRTFVIDSVSRIAALSFGKNASAAYVMKRLVALQMRYGLSLLVIAHDSTASALRALLILADSEIKIAENDTDTSVNVLTNSKDIKDLKAPESIPAITPTSSKKLSRQQRRALKRQAAKDALKA